MTLTSTLIATISPIGDRLERYTATLVDLGSLDPLGVTETQLTLAS